MKIDGIKNLKVKAMLDLSELKQNDDPSMDIFLENMNTIFNQLNHVKNSSYANKRKVAAIIMKTSTYRDKIIDMNYLKNEDLSYFEGVNFNTDVTNKSCDYKRDDIFYNYETVLHAEMTVLSKLNRYLINIAKHRENEINSQFSMFLNHVPCWDCAKNIAVFGKNIKEVIVLVPREQLKDIYEKYVENKKMCIFDENGRPLRYRNLYQFFNDYFVNFYLLGV